MPVFSIFIKEVSFITWLYIFFIRQICPYAIGEERGNLSLFLRFKYLWYAHYLCHLLFNSKYQQGAWKDPLSTVAKKGRICFHPLWGPTDIKLAFAYHSFLYSPPELPSHLCSSPFPHKQCLKWACQNLNAVFLLEMKKTRTWHPKICLGGYRWF